MPYTPRQQIERECFNALVHEKWDGKSLFVAPDHPPFADYSGDLLDGAKQFLFPVSGRRILEIGCGNGELSVWLAKNGATVYGVDISDESITIANRRTAENHVADQAHFYACPAEHVPFENAFFDIVFINVSLHHLEIDLALKEFQRVLKPDGLLIAIEPLAFSSLIQNFRASKLFTAFYPIRQETPTERILSLDDLKLIRSLYSDTVIVPYRVFSPFIYKIKPLFAFLARRCFSREHDFEIQKRKLNRALQKFDKNLLKIFPPLKFLARYAIIRAVSK